MIKTKMGATLGATSNCRQPPLNPVRFVTAAMGRARTPTGNSILLGAEDHPSAVLVPHLQQMGADMSRIFIPDLTNRFDSAGLVH
jgi:hypothetical protein